MVTAAANERQLTNKSSIIRMQSEPIHESSSHPFMHLASNLPGMSQCLSGKSLWSWQSHSHTIRVSERFLLHESVTAFAVSCIDLARVCWLSFGGTNLLLSASVRGSNLLTLALRPPCFRFISRPCSLTSFSLSSQANHSTVLFGSKYRVENSICFQMILLQYHYGRATRSNERKLLCRN